MKKLTIGCVLALVALSVDANHSYHGWRKVSEQTAQGGIKICTWRCTYDTSSPHETVTSGSVHSKRCPRPHG